MKSLLIIGILVTSVAHGGLISSSGRFAPRGIFCQISDKSELQMLPVRGDTFKVQIKHAGSTELLEAKLRCEPSKSNSEPALHNTCKNSSGSKLLIRLKKKFIKVSLVRRSGKRTELRAWKLPIDDCKVKRIRTSSH